jgi:hypothetical protein
VCFIMHFSHWSNASRVDIMLTDKGNRVLLSFRLYFTMAEQGYFPSTQPSPHFPAPDVHTSPLRETKSYQSTTQV